MTASSCDDVILPLSPVQASDEDERLWRQEDSGLHRVGLQGGGVQTEIFPVREQRAKCEYYLNIEII